MFDKVRSNYNYAVDNPNVGDWWFEAFYDELESLVYKGVTEGDFTLKEVEEFSELDDDAPMTYSVGRPV